LNSVHHNLKNKFSTATKWNLSGTIFFEALKLINQFFLLKNMELANYGKLGTIFSIIFLTIHLSGFEAENSIYPFISEITKSKNIFRSFFKNYIFLQILFLVTGATLSLLFLKNKFSLALLIVIFLLIIFEGLRILMRSALYLLFLNKKTILTESALTIAFIILSWAPTLIFHQSPTIFNILLSYLITSIIAVIIFLFFLSSYSYELENSTEKLNTNFLKRIIKTRCLNSLIKSSSYFFSENFLIPFFAFKFGFELAGVFKFASYIARSIKSIAHVIIGFTGGALLSNLKRASLYAKQEAFLLISNQLNKILFFILIFLIINYQNIFLPIYQSKTIILSSTLFLFFIISEHLLTLYEQFYLVEEALNKLITFKMLEFALLYLTLTLGKTLNPVEFFLMLLIIRMLIFVILALNAYTLWKIKPNFKIQLKFLLITIAVSLIFLAATNLLRL